MRTGSPFGIVSGVCGPGAGPSSSGRSIIGTIVAGARRAGRSTSRVGSLGACSTGWGTTPSRSNTTGSRC